MMPMMQRMKVNLLHSDTLIEVTKIISINLITETVLLENNQTRSC
jgi:hypothetical protein